MPPSSWCNDYTHNIFFFHTVVPFFSFKTFKIDKFTWLGLFWETNKASWSSLFNCCSSSFLCLHLFLEYRLEYFLTLYFTQSRTERGSLRSCFPSWSHVGRRQFISLTYCLSFRREQFNFQNPGPSARSSPSWNSIIMAGFYGWNHINIANVARKGIRNNPIVQPRKNQRFWLTPVKLSFVGFSSSQISCKSSSDCKGWFSLAYPLHILLETIYRAKYREAILC